MEFATGQNNQITGRDPWEISFETLGYITELIMEKIDTFGNTFLGCVLAIIILHIFFSGEPDVTDAIREIMLKYSGLVQ